jgi:glycosyltransferase involved in cell wall biosynthesis
VEHETGLLAEDFDDFVRHTDTLLRDKPLRKAMGAAGRQRAQQFSWEESLDAFESVVHSALRLPRRPVTREHRVVQQVE